MNQKILIQNALIVNEGLICKSDLLIENDYIKKIDANIIVDNSVQIIDASGHFLIPGLIDDQVHFREPGLTHKATIASESKAAIAGGITSFIEMPNTNPPCITQELLEDKFKIAENSSLANYSFMIGGTNNNLEELLKTNPKNVAGIKLFLGSSTGNMLVDDDTFLEKLFLSTDLLIAVHCEDESTIQKNIQIYKEKFGENIPIEFHPIIRSEEACYLSSSKVIELAKKTGARLHVFHLSTAKETNLFSNKIALKDKRITAEVCIHHLWFDDSDYQNKGNFIKWNPAIKSENDKKELLKALLDNRIDVIATDHAPHTLDEKNQVYAKAPSGGPLVQHALPALLEMVHQQKITIEKLVEKSCHNPAILFQINKRGFIKEGYFADLVLINMNNPWNVTKENILYKCGWSPFEGVTFQSKITHTFVNGNLVYQNGNFISNIKGKRLEFNR